MPAVFATAYPCEKHFDIRSLEIQNAIFCIDGKMCCYLWVHKKYRQPYLGIVEGARISHPDLIQEKRARMKILLIDHEKNIPLRKIDEILNAMIALYKK